MKYRLAHIERKRLLLVNPNLFGGGAANSVIRDNNANIATYLDNLALAATNDNMATSCLTAQLDAITTRLNDLSTAASIRANNPNYIAKLYSSLTLPDMSLPRIPCPILE